MLFYRTVTTSKAALGSHTRAIASVKSCGDTVVYQNATEMTVPFPEFWENHFEEELTMHGQLTSNTNGSVTLLIIMT